jgi:mannose/cellobiose epimerase-like protein (N-acyl-D-glucosamine 2-epimerase family)
MPVGNEREQLQQTARAARRRCWDTDTACFYAKRRFDQSGRDEDRLVWRDREQEAREAATALEAAEEALLRLPS